MSYIGAELLVRLIYDSLILQRREKLSIWSSTREDGEEAAFAEYYTKKLFSRTKLQEKKKKERLAMNEQKLNSTAAFLVKQFKRIYPWDKRFRYTNMATCTYTVAIVFLYYLACTFIFLYVSRTTGYLFYLRDFIEHAFNLGKTEIASMIRWLMITHFRTG